MIRNPSPYSLSPQRRQALPAADIEFQRMHQPEMHGPHSQLSSSESPVCLESSAPLNPSVANPSVVNPVDGVMRRVDSAAELILPSPHFDCSREETVLEYLSFAEQVLNNPGAPEATIELTMRKIYAVLLGFRNRASASQWAKFVQRCREHSIARVIHQDPFTRRAFEKPRGYSGDAILMDHIYGREEGWAAPTASPIGARIHRYTTASSACRGVMYRRGFIADLIDDLAREVHQPEILSMAAGHLREAGISAAVQRRQIGRFVAVDSDTESLAEINKSYPKSNIDCQHASARQVMSGRIDLGKFDLAYSSGLYDYLNESIGQRLTKNLFNMLKPGGVLLLTNFLPNVECAGYMETFMDWNLIYRDRCQMMQLTKSIPENQIDQVTTFAEEQHNIVFCMVRRRA